MRSRGPKPVPPVVTTRPAKPSASSTERLGHRRRRRRPPPAGRRPSKPAAVQHARPSAAPDRSSRVPATTPSDTVSTLACERPRRRRDPCSPCDARAGSSAVSPRRAAGTMPSVPAAWGSSRAPRPCGRHGAPGRRERLELGWAVGQPVVDAGRLGRGERAHAVDERRRRARTRSAAGVEQRALQRGQPLDGVGLDAPAGVGPAPRATPRPEHGASTSTRSNEPGPARRRGGRRRPTTATRRRARAARRCPRPGRRATGRTSAATTTRRRWRPGASPCRPGRRTGRRPARPARRRPASATHCEARSWT